MMRRQLLAAMLAGCAAYEDRVSELGRTMSPVDERIIHGDTQFTVPERRAAEHACAMWSTWTKGRVRLSIRWDLDDMTYMDLPPPLLYRVWQTAETGTMGGRTQGDLIWWVPDACPDLDACVAHEIGHMLGLQHVASAGQVMSPRNASHVFGVEDYRECVRVGVCRERAPDYTTVTVTVDPNMPNPSLEFPP
jgi:hypothetical protein